MNVFEIFQTEGNIEQALFAGIVMYQNHWLAFRDIIDHLFATLQFTSTIPVDFKSTPHWRCGAISIATRSSSSRSSSTTTEVFTRLY